MRFSDLLKLALSNLGRRKLRTSLTVLGVIIGCASLNCSHAFYCCRSGANAFETDRV